MAILDSNVVYIGTQINLALESDNFFDGYNLSEVLKNVTIYSGNINKNIKLYKESLSTFPEDNNKYIISVNTKNIGTGAIKIIIEVEIPEDNNKRKELYTYNTGIYIVNTI